MASAVLLLMSGVTYGRSTLFSLFILCMALLGCALLHIDEKKFLGVKDMAQLELAHAEAAEAVLKVPSLKEVEARFQPLIDQLPTRRQSEYTNQVHDVCDGFADVAGQYATLHHMISYSEVRIEADRFQVVTGTIQGTHKMLDAIEGSILGELPGARMLNVWVSLDAVHAEAVILTDRFEMRFVRSGIKRAKKALKKLEQQQHQFGKDQFDEKLLELEGTVSALHGEVEYAHAVAERYKRALGQRIVEAAVRISHQPVSHSHRSSWGRSRCAKLDHLDGTRTPDEVNALLRDV